MAGDFKPWRAFLTQGGDAKQLRKLDFPGGRTLRKVAEKSGTPGDVKLLKEHGLA